jgi:hypothetical protein
MRCPVGNSIKVGPFARVAHFSRSALAGMSRILVEDDDPATHHPQAEGSRHTWVGS